MHSDTNSFAGALRAALRQAPKVILVGEMGDRETIEIALEAAETRHLVMSTLHTIDAAKTVERIVGVFPFVDQMVIRNRMAKSFATWFHADSLPAKTGSGRVAAIEILKSTLRALVSTSRKAKAKAGRCLMRCEWATTRACSTSTEKWKN